MNTCYVNVEYIDKNLKRFELLKLSSMIGGNLIFRTPTNFSLDISDIKSIAISSINRDNTPRKFILLDYYLNETDQFDLDFLYEVVMINNNCSYALITKSVIVNKQLGFNGNKSYIYGKIKHYNLYTEEDIYKNFKGFLKKREFKKMKTTDQYCYVDVEHRDDIINKTITNSYLKLIGLENDSYVFWNFNEDGIFKLEIDRVKSIKINSIVNHNQNPNYVFVSQIFDKIPDDQLLHYIHEVIFCSEDNSVALLCKTNIVDGNICFNGNDVFLIRNINDYKLYKKEDVVNKKINEKSTDCEFDDIKMISFEDFKHEYLKAIRENFVVIIKHIVEQINRYFEDFCDGVIYDTCIFELRMCESDKKVFLENDGFGVLKTILSKNGWVVEEIEFHNDGLFLIITFKL